MNYTEYRVTFTTGQCEIVCAFSAQEARILAQARQIRKGNKHEVKTVEEISGG